MIQSMTGYGRFVAELPEKNVVIEIKSLNSKQLDLNSRIASVYRDKELEIRNYISSQLVRGKVDVIVTSESKDGVGERKIQDGLVKSYFEKFNQLAQELGVSNVPALELALKMPDVWASDNQSLASDEEWDKVKQTLEKATSNIVMYRRHEGEALDKDLRRNIQTISDLLASIEPFEKARVGKIREKIEAALQEFIESDKIDKNRLEQEMIFYLEKLDINEEKVRLAQHCKYFIDTMDNEEYAGKKLNFIAQEMGREINTMGSKSNDADMQRIVVQMKDNLEKIKFLTYCNCMKENKMIILSAPSGSGKSPIINYLLHKGFPLEFSVSATTRAPRGTEKNGVEYYFYSVDEFKKKIKNGDFVEFEEVYENRFYGTLKSECERIWAKGNVIVFDVDVAGGMRLKKLFGDKALSLFIQAPSVEVLRQRLEGRKTDSAEEIEKRISKAAYEMQFADKFDAIVVNDELQKACETAEHLLQDFLNK